MKKSLIALSIAAMALSVGLPALAKDNGDHKNRGAHMMGFMGEGKHLGQIKNLNLTDSQFLVVGAIAAVGTNSLTVNEQNSMHVANITNGQVIITTNADTKIFDRPKDDDSLTLASLKVGDKVVIVGNISGSILTATDIRVMMDYKKHVATGSVTAKTGNSITIQNNLTGVSQTFTTDGNTKVNINGENKTTADIQVGDKGFVKFKNQVSGFLAKLINLFR